MFALSTVLEYNLPSFLRGGGGGGGGGQCLWSPVLIFQKEGTAFWRQTCFSEVQGLTGNLAQTELGYQ